MRLLKLLALVAVVACLSLPFSAIGQTVDEGGQPSAAESQLVPADPSAEQESSEEVQPDQNAGPDSQQPPSGLDGVPANGSTCSGAEGEYIDWVKDAVARSYDRMGTLLDAMNSVPEGTSWLYSPSAVSRVKAALVAFRDVGDELRSRRDVPDGVSAINALAVLLGDDYVLFSDEVLAFIDMPNETASSAGAEAMRISRDHVNELRSQVREWDARCLPEVPNPPTPVPTSTPRPAARPAATPTPLPTLVPTPTPQPTAQPLRVLQQGYGRAKEDLVGYAIVVENPNLDRTVEMETYAVSLYDANGGFLTSITGNFEMVPPGAKQGVSGSMLVNRKATVARMDLKVDPPRSFNTSVPQPFGVEGLTYHPSDDPFWLPKVSATIRSNYPANVNNLQVFAVCYDSSGTIIGGGGESIDLIRAKGTVDVEISLRVSGVPSRIELYPRLTGLSSIR